jgi:hypothetical protein
MEPHCTFAAVFLWYVIRPSKYVLPKVAMLPVSDYVYIMRELTFYLPGIRTLVK